MDCSPYRDQLKLGTEKSRRQALEQLIMAGVDGWPILQDFLTDLRDSGLTSSQVDSVAGRVYCHLSQQNDPQLQQFLQKTFEQGFVPLASERGVDYRPLEAYLVRQDFEAADRLTLEKLCELAGPMAQQRKWIYFSEVDQLPVVDLQSLDRLWRVYSDNQFGYSVQRDIWLSVGKTWDKLWPKIGWKDGNLWTRYPQGFTWDLCAPRGHLPLTNQLRGVRVMASLMNHPAFS